VYIAVARLLTTVRAPRWAFGAWVGATALAITLMYPFTPL
jgi:hypothetical protein